jgi:hypothetical protein
MSKNRYLAGPKLSPKVPGSLFEKQRYTPNIVNILPCIKSPNMTPKKNGKEMHVKIAGLTSLYVGIPYVSTIY